MPPGRLTLRALAAEVGCSFQFLSYVEDGRSLPGDALFARIAAALGADPDELAALAHHAAPSAEAGVPTVRAGPSRPRHPRPGRSG